MEFEFNLFKFDEKVRACIWEHTQRYRFAADKTIYKFLNTNTDWSKWDKRTPGGNRMSDALSKSTQKLFHDALPSFDEWGTIDKIKLEASGGKWENWVSDYVERFCKRFGKERLFTSGEGTRSLYGRVRETFEFQRQIIPWKFNAVGSYIDKGDFSEEYFNRILAKHGLVIRRESRRYRMHGWEGNELGGPPEETYWCIQPAPKTCSRSGCNDAVHEGGRCLKHHNDLLATRAKKAAKGK